MRKQLLSSLLVAGALLLGGQHVSAKNIFPSIEADGSVQLNDGYQAIEGDKEVVDSPYYQLYPEDAKTRTPISAKGLALDSSNIKIYNYKDQSTWLPNEYAHYMDISQAKVTAVAKSGATITKTEGNGAATGRGSRFAIGGLSVKRGTGFNEIPVDIELKVANVKWGAQTIDMVMKINRITVANLGNTGDSGTTASATQKDMDEFNQELQTGTSVYNAGYASSIYFREQDGIPSFVIHPRAPVNDMRYTIAYYKSGTTTPVTVTMPHIYGDQEGARGTSQNFGDFMGNIANNEYGEYLRLSDSSGSSKYPTFYFNAANGKEYAGTSYIPELGREGDFKVGVWKYKVGTSNDNLILKGYGLKLDSGLWNFRGPNVNQYLPLEAQWSYLFKGNETNNQEQGWHYSASRTLSGQGAYVQKPEKAQQFWNFLGYISILPSKITGPSKWVSDTDETMVKDNVLEEAHEKFTYTLEGNFPIQQYSEFNLKSWRLTDSIPEGLTVDTSAITAHVYSESGVQGKEIKSSFDIKLSGRTLTISAKASLLEDLKTYGVNSKVRFKVPVRVTDLDKVTRDDQGHILITNRVTESGTYFNDQDFSLKSNDVTTKIPVEEALSVNKSVDKTIAEIGKDDPVVRNQADLQPVTYKIEVSNQTGLSSVDQVRIFDLLPIAGDGRGTTLPNRGKVVAIDAVDDQGNVMTKGLRFWYKDLDSPMAVDAVDYDPNQVDWQDPTKQGWSKVPDASDLSKGLATSAVLMDIDNLPAGKSYSLRITVDYSGNHAGLVMDNTAQVTSITKRVYQTNQVETKLYGRKLTGMVWIDSNANGLKDQSESMKEGVAVKLYRTSLSDNTYVKELVKKSITGGKFVDDKGVSLVKTDKNGAYSFGNLPEGDYIVEFDYDQADYTVTQPLVDSSQSDTINSKVDPTKGQILALPQAGSKWSRTGHLLQDLPSLTALTKDLETLPYNNMGLVPIAKSGQLKLFKYQSGTLVDKDGDGQYSEQELSAAKGLSGAKFQIYRGKLTVLPSDGAANSDYIGEYVTDDKGQLLVTDGLVPINDYTVFEVEAPKGYELYKQPIHFRVTQNKQVINLQVSDDKVTQLPEAGGRGSQAFVGLAIVITMAGIVLALVTMSYYKKRIVKK